MSKIFLLLLVFMSVECAASQILHHDLKNAINEEKENVYIWEEKNVTPFDELIISWNAQRPKKGYYLISVSVFIDDWSNWVDYAYWSGDDQSTFDIEDATGILKTYQDAIEIKKGKATGFKISVKALAGASLANLRSIHACASHLKEHKVIWENIGYHFVNLNIPGLSQVAIPDKRNMRLCSPTSTTAVVNYLLFSNLQPLSFAECARDSGFDIFGNWVLNTAQASHHLGNQWSCYVTRLISFNQILDILRDGYPVVVSIKGPIKNGAFPYASGHIIVVKGYNPITQEVLCMDPAFENDHLTYVNYPLKDFVMAWARRKGIAYLFFQNEG